MVGRECDQGWGLVEDRSMSSSRDRHVIRDDAGLILNVVTLGSDQLGGVENEPMAVGCAVIGGDRGGTAATLRNVRWDDGEWKIDGRVGRSCNRRRIHNGDNTESGSDTRRCADTWRASRAGGGRIPSLQNTASNSPAERL